VYDDFEEHFSSEEKLFLSVGYGDRKNPKGQFSASRGHILEHEKMLKNMEDEVSWCYGTHPLGPSTRPTDEGSPSGKARLVRKRFVQQVVDEFVEHIEMYDSKYVAHVAKFNNAKQPEIEKDVSMGGSSAGANAKEFL